MQGFNLNMFYAMSIAYIFHHKHTKRHTSVSRTVFVELPSKAILVHHKSLCKCINYANLDLGRNTLVPLLFQLLGISMGKGEFAEVRNTCTMYLISVVTG